MTDVGMTEVSKLEIWQESTRLVTTIYRLTANWPTDERFGLIAQTRRAAVSIPSNLAEGLGRGSPGEMARFGNIALGSLYELDTLLVLAQNLELTSEDLGPLRAQLALLAKRTTSFVRYHQTTHHTPHTTHL